MLYKDGHTVSQGKLKAIQDWEAPASETEVWAFLGTVNFLTKSCKDF